MATIVCQGLQSCLDSQLVGRRPLRLKLSSPEPQFPQPLEFGQKCQTSSTPDRGGWSFIQALSDTSKSSITQKEKPYVPPPQMKRTLSEKSLKLCTENLGSETGTDFTEEDSMFSLSSPSSSSDSKSGYSLTRKQQNPRSFPPPLTTMRGSESIQVRSLRDDGRLIIEAVKVPSTDGYFQAERSHGRLRLTLFKDFSSSSSSSSSFCCGFDYFSDADNEENEEEFENDSNIEFVTEESVVVEEEEEEMDGYRINVGDEMGSEKINQRPTRFVGS